MPHRAPEFPTVIAVAFALATAACGGTPTGGNDAGGMDGGSNEAGGMDAGGTDVARADSSGSDAVAADEGSADAGRVDSGVAEVCGNNVDDDGNGRTDCQDPACVTDPACPPYCGAASGARCYYVDATRGDDANDGSFSHPWRTYLNAATYYGTPGENGSTSPPSGHVDLQPGDALYFMDGTYSATFNYNGSITGFFARNVSGSDGRPIVLAAYPGQHAVFHPAVQARAIELLDGAWWVVEGIEIDGAYTRGISLEGDDHVAVHAVHIHDTDGVDNDNVAGLYLTGATNVEVWDSEIHDNYDRTAADTNGMPTENSMNVVLFDGGFVNFHDNHVYNTPSASRGMHGGGIKYKHMRSVPGGTFTVAHNRFEDCAFMSIGTGSPDTTIVGNLVRNSAPIVLKNFAGPTQLSNVRVSYNTLVPGAIVVEPGESDAPATNLRFDHNVVIDDATVYNTDNGIVAVGPYEDDATYDYVTANGVLGFSANCYANPATAPVFDFFGAGGTWGAAGGLYDFAQWQAQGYDADSFQEDPALDAAFRATSAHCAAAGYDHAP